MAREVLLQDCFDDCGLTSLRLRVEACPPASCERWMSAGQRAGDGAGRRGIADAHFSDGQEDDSGTCRLASQCRTGQKGLGELFIIHGGLVKHVRRTSSDLVVKQARDSSKLRIYPHVDHVQIDAVQTREHVDGSPARKEIEHHLVRDRARIRADALGGDAVVCCKNVYRFPNWDPECLPTDGDDLRRQIFKPAQTAERLGERIEASPGTSAPGARRAA